MKPKEEEKEKKRKKKRKKKKEKKGKKEEEKINKNNARDSYLGRKEIESKPTNRQTGKQKHTQKEK